RAVRDTLAVDPTYPLIASHGDVAHLCDVAGKAPCIDDLFGPVSERYLEAEYAKRIFDRRGVLGFTTSAGNFSQRAIIVGHGGPLLAFSPMDPSACMALPNTTGCRDTTSTDFDPKQGIETLEVVTRGIVENADRGNAHPFARIEMRARTDVHSFQ